MKDRNYNKIIFSLKPISFNNNNLNIINSKNTLNVNQHITLNSNKKSFISKMKIIKNNNGVNDIKPKIIKENQILSKSIKDIPKIIKQSIGINTSKYSEKMVPNMSKQEKSLITSGKVKSKIKEDCNSTSSLYKQYYIGYNENGEFIDNEKIKELRRNLKSFSVDQNRIYKYFPYQKHKKRKIIHKKGSLLTYNFNKNTYSNYQRSLINIYNSNIVKNNINNNKSNKLIYNLKRQKTAKINNYQSLNIPNIKIKSCSGNDKNIKKYKQIHRNKLFFQNVIKKSDSMIINTNTLNNDEINILNKDEIKKKNEVLKIVEEPNNLLNYIYNNIQELKEHKILLFKNRKKGNRYKLDNLKNELKTIEQDALYQVFNLRYERIPGDEINIKTNIFCTKKYF